MQEVYNAAWYSGNQLIKYPIDSNATGYSDSGDPLPTSILSDIRMVSTRSRTLRVGGITCSEYLVSVVISDGNDMVAAITVPQPVTPFEHYVLESFSDDVSGVIAFGTADTYGKWRFSSNSQSKLAPTCQIILNAWPVTSFSDDLRGDIILNAASGISIGIESRLIGTTRMSGVRDNGLKHVQAIVIRGNPETSTYTTREDTDKMYLGKCATRPDNSDNNSESKCRYILGIGAATPDCNGNIDIELTSNDDNISVSLSTTTSGLVETECDTSLTRCNAIIISGSQEREPYEPMEFGNKGTDLCADDEETDESGPLVMRSINLKDDTYPSQGEGLEYQSSSGLTNTGNVPAIASIDESCEYTRATFKMESGGICGFVWNDDQYFLYNGSVITFDDRTIPLVTSAGTIKMEMSITNGVLTARILSGELLLATMDCECEEMSDISIYLYEDFCTEWRIG